MVNGGSTGRYDLLLVEGEQGRWMRDSLKALPKTDIVPADHCESRRDGSASIVKKVCRLGLRSSATAVFHSVPASLQLSVFHCPYVIGASCQHSLQ